MPVNEKWVSLSTPAVYGLIIRDSKTIIVLVITIAIMSFFNFSLKSDFPKYQKKIIRLKSIVPPYLSDVIRYLPGASDHKEDAEIKIIKKIIKPKFRVNLGKTLTWSLRFKINARGNKI
jgi:hypothetical protein